LLSFLLRNDDCTTIEQTPDNIPVHVVWIRFNFWIHVNLLKNWTVRQKKKIEQSVKKQIGQSVKKKMNSPSKKKNWTVRQKKNLTVRQKKHWTVRQKLRCLLWERLTIWRFCNCRSFVYLLCWCNQLG